ncbi:MAG: DUF2927 domain-containing protein [Bacteroidota bacterium]|nr:DUF2927 domain-containing protein [Kiloniellaceae bacterium]
MSLPLPAALLGALLLLVGCAADEGSRRAAPTTDPAEAAQLEDFRRLVFGPAGGQLAKWQRPLRVALVDVPDARARQIARDHLMTLASLSGLAVEEAEPRGANLLVFFADDPVESARRHRGLYGHRVTDTRQFESMLSERADSTCFGFLWGGWPTGGGIDFATVFVRTDRGERTLQGCLVQQTAQVLGLRHDLDPDADSLFSDSGRHDDLTDSDRVMLRLLYDERLKPGQRWPEAEPLARAALRDIKGESR